VGRHDRFGGFLLGNIFRQLQQNCSGPLFLGPPETLSYERGNPLSIYDLLRHLAQGGKKRDDIDDLELCLLRDLDGFLAGYHDKRESAQSGISRGRREVCRPWPQRGKAYTGVTGKTSIGCRHEPCPLLVPGNDQTDRRGPQ
jgi:hypothetical protein